MSNLKKFNDALARHTGTLSTEDIIVDPEGSIRIEMNNGVATGVKDTPEAAETEVAEASEEVDEAIEDAEETEAAMEGLKILASELDVALSQNGGLTVEESDILTKEYLDLLARAKVSAPLCPSMESYGINDFHREEATKLLRQNVVLSTEGIGEKIKAAAKIVWEKIKLWFRSFFDANAKRQRTLVGVLKVVQSPQFKKYIEDYKDTVSKHMSNGAADTARVSAPEFGNDPNSRNKLIRKTVTSESGAELRYTYGPDNGLDVNYSDVTNAILQLTKVVMKSKPTEIAYCLPQIATIVTHFETVANTGDLSGPSADYGTAIDMIKNQIKNITTDSVKKFVNFDIKEQPIEFKLDTTNYKHNSDNGVKYSGSTSESTTIRFADPQYTQIKSIFIENAQIDAAGLANVITTCIAYYAGLVDADKKYFDKINAMFDKQFKNQDNLGHAEELLLLQKYTQDLLRINKEAITIYGTVMNTLSAGIVGLVKTLAAANQKQ